MELEAKDPAIIFVYRNGQAFEEGLLRLVHDHFMVDFEYFHELCCEHPEISIADVASSLIIVVFPEFLDILKLELVDD